MAETILGLFLVVAILAVSALVTHLFASAMYRRCSECNTLNARRRSECRACGHGFGGDGVAN